MIPTGIKSSDNAYPAILRERLGDHAPNYLTVLGDPELLSQPKMALFCSVRCPDDVSARAYEKARRLRDDGVTVIGGFHSPVEQECLNILLTGKQPIIICLLRALSERTRTPNEWQRALDTGRLLLLSQFEKRRRPDQETARKRNQLVAALSDEVLFIHATPGGAIAQISELVTTWRVPMSHLGDSA